MSRAGKPWWTPGQFNVVVDEGLGRAAKQLRGLGPALAAETRARGVTEIVDPVADRLRAAGMAQGTYGAMGAASIRVMRGGVPTIRAGAAKRAASGGLTQSGALVGSEFGSNHDRKGYQRRNRSRAGVHLVIRKVGTAFPGRASQGRWFWPTVEESWEPVLDAWQRLLDDVLREAAS